MSSNGVSTYNNVDTYKATGDAYLGELFNIAHDGSAIYLGNEPSVSLDTKDLDTDWSINVILKTSSTTQQCVFSIDDGAGGRYIDLMHDADKVTLYYEGVETSVTYTTETLPYEDWIHVGIGVDSSENKLTVSAEGIYTDVTTTTSPVIPSGRLVRFFRPVHVEDLYFDGIIDTHRISSCYQTLTLTHASAFVFYSQTQVDTWVVNSSSVWAVGFSDSTVETTYYQASSGPDTKYHSFCRYDDDYMICNNRESFGSIVTIQTNTQTTRPVCNQQHVFGMHYFEFCNLLLFVDASTGTLDSFYVGDGTSNTTVNTVSSDGTYLLCRGDLHDRYLFGSKIASDGSTHQIFRTDHQGLNEITVDCLTLFGTNEQVENFACNVDDDLLYFGHPSTHVLHSLDFDLANLTGYTLELNSGVDSDIEYSDGWLYWANKNPLGSSDNTSLWRMNVNTDEYQKFSTKYNLAGDAGQQALYVDRPNNTLVVIGSGTYYITSTEIDFATPGMTKGFQTPSSVDLAWPEIESATGYNILQNGVVIASNVSATSLSVTGLTVDTFYKFTLEYTTDGTNFVSNKFYNAAFRSTENLTYFPQIPNLFENVTVSNRVGFSNPYTANELLVPSGNNLYKYDIAASTSTLLGEIRNASGYVANRQWHNKRIYFKNGTKIHDAGIDIENLNGYTTTNNFLLDDSTVVFDHSVSSNGDTADIYSHATTLDGSAIYYSTQDEQMWKYDTATKTSTLIYTGEGTSNMRSFVIDPLNQNSMIFMDNSILKTIDLDTLAVSELLPSMSHTNALDLLGGKVYGAKYYGNFFTVNIDGTEYQESMKPGGYTFHALYLDTVNKRVILFENSTCKIRCDNSIADLPSDPSVFVVTPRPISLDIVWQEVEGATSYSVRYSVGDSDAMVSSVEATTSLRHIVKNLDSETTYMLYLYYSIDEESPSILVGSSTQTTLPNIPGNFHNSSFSHDDGDGSFDLTGLTSTTLESLEEIINDLFDTGDKIHFKVGPSSTAAKFLKRGGTTDIENEVSVAIPFNTSSGSGQNATLTLSNATNVTVAYDETTEEVTIDGKVYSSGQSLVLDGKKVTLYNV